VGRGEVRGYHFRKINHKDHTHLHCSFACEFPSGTVKGEGKEGTVERDWGSTRKHSLRERGGSRRKMEKAGELICVMRQIEAESTKI